MKKTISKLISVKGGKEEKTRRSVEEAEIRKVVKISIFFYRNK